MKNIVRVESPFTVKDLDECGRYPVVVRVNEFNQEAIESFEKDFSEAHSTGQPIVPVVIDSYGGSVYGCMSMISTVLNSKLPVATIVSGKAMSAGAILFSFGSPGHRYLDPKAVLMIHDLYADIDGKIEDIKVDARHLEELNIDLYKRMAKHVGKNQNYFLDIIKNSSHTDVFLTAAQAKRHGMATTLKIPTLELSVRTEYKFGV
jgi:ATP-dependent Clp protease protease subunit